MKSKIEVVGHCRDGTQSSIDFLIDKEEYRYYADQAYVDIALSRAEYTPGKALAFIKRNCTLCIKR